MKRFQLKIPVLNTFPPEFTQKVGDFLHEACAVLRTELIDDVPSLKEITGVSLCLETELRLHQLITVFIIGKGIHNQRSLETKHELFQSLKDKYESWTQEKKGGQRERTRNFIGTEIDLCPLNFSVESIYIQYLKQVQDRSYGLPFLDLYKTLLGDLISLSTFTFSEVRKYLVPFPR